MPIDPNLAFFLAGSLGPALVEVFKTLATEGVVKPALRPMQELVTRGYDQAKDAAALAKAISEALDGLDADANLSDIDKLVAALKFGGQEPSRQRQLAAAAVGMLRQDPASISDGLLGELGLESRHRALLANFLSRLRQRLEKVEDYQAGIFYANDLEKMGLLSQTLRRVDAIARNTARTAAYHEQLMKLHHLAAEDEPAYHEYLRDQIEQLGRLPLPLARQRTGPAAARLRQVFVPLTMRDQRAEEHARRTSEKMLAKPTRKVKPGGSAEELKTEPASLSRILERYRSIILIGPPGSGKTTLLRRAGLAFAEGSAAVDLEWKDAPLLFPVYIRLRNFGAFLKEHKAEHTSPGPGALTAYLGHHFRKVRNLNLPADFFERRLKAGHCLLLLDGLDEVTELRSEVAQQVNAFITHFISHGEGNRFALGSRPKGYESVEIHLRGSELAVCDVNPLPPEGVRRLISNLFEFIESDSNRQAHNSRKLGDKITTTPKLLALAANPLSCTALVQVFQYHGADLPQRRVDIFQEVVDLLLGYWKAQDDELADAARLGAEDVIPSRNLDLKDAVSRKRRRLSVLAYQMQLSRKVEIDRGEAVRLVAKHLRGQERARDQRQAREWAEEFLERAQEFSGLLVEIEQGRYAFVHEYYREYLAAVALLNLSETNFLGRVVEYANKDAWWEIIRLAGAHDGPFEARRQKMIEQILKAALAEKQRGDLDGWLERLHLAGGAAADMGDRLPGPQQEKIERVLIEAMSDASLEPPRRAATGEILDELGYLPPDLYDFIHIPAGEGMSEFWIGKYPVTNAQYERFALAEDFGQPDLWGEEGYAWLKKKWDKERRLYPRLWNDIQFGQGRRAAPVVGVSWYEAQAYCRWLQAHWGELEIEERLAPGVTPKGVRLLFQQEWQRAAGGEHSTGGKKGERYPWDGEGVFTAANDLQSILLRANVYESEIRRTTRVDQYPQGASQPYGLWDLAGNVWEWQIDETSGRMRGPALRGGSWDYNSEYARVAARHDVGPGLRNFSFGFRVLALPNALSVS